MSLGTTLDPSLYPDIPIAPGLEICGVPIGSEEFVRRSLLKIVGDSVQKTNKSVSTLPSAQHRNLLIKNCCGTVRVQHLWQSISPELGSNAAQITDNYIRIALLNILAIDHDINDSCFTQSSLPTTLGGLGYRLSEQIYDAAYLGGWSIAAFGDFNISVIDPSLHEITQRPENFSQSIPSLRGVCQAWDRCTRLWTLPNGDPCLTKNRAACVATATVMGVLAPASLFVDLPQENSADPLQSIIRQMDDFNESFIATWKAETVEGKESMSGFCTKGNETLLEKADAAFAKRSDPTQAQDPWFQLVEGEIGCTCDFFANAMQTPQLFPSIMRLMYICGQRKFQRFFTRLNDMKRFEDFFNSIESQSLQIRFRAQLHHLASIPLTVIPSHRGREFENAIFVWYIANRTLMDQPSSEPLGNLRCTCGAHIDGGRHFRKCKVRGGIMRVHDAVRDQLHKMFKSAGLLSSKEPKYLLPDNANDRPADNLVQDWVIPREPFTTHAIDVTLPLPDSSLRWISSQERCLRASTVGHLAEKATQRKRDDTGTPTERQFRGNSATMQERCRLQRIHFWPIGIEGDGVPSKEFSSLIKNTSKTAAQLRGHDAIAFGRKWTTDIGCTIARTSASVSLARCLATKLFRRRSPPQDPIVGEPQLDVPDETNHRAFRNSYSDNRLQDRSRN